MVHFEMSTTYGYCELREHLKTNANKFLRTNIKRFAKLTRMTESKGWDRFKELYLMEKHRIESFRHWPFDDNSRCNLTKMAEAGFYWTGNERENDTATCFVCGKTLDGWEASDDPWKEHAKHAPQCLFVKYNKNENDITVDEFLNIFSEVMQNHITKRVEETKKRVESMARKELNLFLEKK